MQDTDNFHASKYESSKGRNRTCQLGLLGVDY